MTAAFTAKPRPNHSTKSGTSCDKRHGVAAGDQDAERRLGHPETSNYQAKRNADDDGEAIAEQERLHALQQRRAELAIAGELDERREDRARIGAEDRIDVAAEIFPEQQQHDDGRDSDRPARHAAFGGRSVSRFMCNRPPFRDIGHACPQCTVCAPACSACQM
jgi:hypothetical protein